MERNEMVQVLMGKAHVSYEVAQAALENSNWDLLDAIIYLERSGKVENNETTTIIEVTEVKEDKKDKNKKKEDKHGGFGEIIGRIFRFIGKVIKKGNENYLDISKENEKPIRLSLTVLILLAIFLTIPTVVLLVVGLFCGYKYSITGPSMNYDGVNNIFEEVAKSADNIKSDFKEGYENK